MEIAMQSTNQSLSGQRFGRWTVQDACILTAKGERKWLCRCDCGTERYVLERSLKYGGSCSCGCLRKEQHHKAVAIDLTGRNFGDLTVLNQSEYQRKNGGVWWTCQCSCGKTYDCPATLLIHGKRTHCGCKTNRGRPTDIAGNRFRRLTAEYMLPERDSDGNVIWHCRCDCGNEVDYSYNDLVYSDVQSCGCQKKEHDQLLKTYLTHIAGTSLEMIKSQKVPTDNTTGYRGVYLIKGKYVAKIVFQKRQYFLGTYENIEKAAEARMNAEKVLFEDTVLFYKKWKEKADEDAKWAKDNPVDIQVMKDSDGKLKVYYSPTI